MRALKKALPVFVLLAIVGGSAYYFQNDIKKYFAAQKSKKDETVKLTYEEAVQRAQIISNVKYKLYFELDEKNLDYSGKVTISFQHQKSEALKEQKTFIDFSKGTIIKMVVNDKEQNPSYDGKRIYLSLANLNSGDNNVYVEFKHPYSNTGSGLHRFQDPQDKKVYLYTDLEPYDANSVFPCFDQPDLKASYELTVDAPKEWTVIANTFETKKESLTTSSQASDQSTNSTEKSRWLFPVSPIFSTYIFAMHAGSYHEWRSFAKPAGSSDIVPLRLFSRESIAIEVTPDDWFQVTEAGLSFFNEKFGYLYPYKKYDQIIVPEFSSGAMENVAAVTFSERYVYRSKVTESMRRRRASVILHEMAHMWFGDLVTMDWWNGLWLNESFATFTSSWALSNLEEKLKLPGSWSSFFGTKEWAYEEDQLVTTHPIEVPVADTDEAFSNFDGITYGKGASVLKQLMFFLGEDNFTKGLHIYFKDFAEQNTNIDDFMGALEKGSGTSLASWKKQFLEHEGVNEIQTKWTCQDGKIDNFVLEQQTKSVPSGKNILRQHRTQIALFYTDGDGKAVRLGKVQPVTYEADQTPVDELKGEACPQFVFPNYGDYDYVEIRLDDQSYKTIQASLDQFQDPLLAQMIFYTLWKGIVDGHHPVQEYVETALKFIPSFKDEIVQKRVIQNLQTALWYVAPSHRQELWSRLENFSYEQFEKSEAASDLQLIWFQAYLGFLKTEVGLKRAQGWLEQKNVEINGLKIDQDRRWEIVTALSKNGVKTMSDPEDSTKQISILEQERKNDLTDKGERSYIYAEASLPDLAIKKKWWAEITKDPKAETKLSLAKLKEAMSGLFHLGQEDLTEKFIEPFFDILPELAKEESLGFISNFSSRLYPEMCSASVSQMTSRFLREHPSIQISIIKNLKEKDQEGSRCDQARRISGNFFEGRN